MTLTNLNTTLKALLRKYIKDRKHIKTGSLYRSVNFKCVDNSSGLLIKFTSNFYIQYLEHKDFVDNFFKLDTTKRIIGKYVVSSLGESIKINK